MGQQTLAPSSFWCNWNVLRLDPRKSMRSIKAWCWWHIGFMLPTKKSECETWWRDILKTKPHLPLENENQVSTVGTHVLGKKTSISAPHLAATFPATTCNSRWTRWTTISGRPAMEHCMLWTSSDKRQDAKELDLLQA